ncbi:MAG: hypothetical protein ACYCTV_10840 [Leptospirales bacterium]
MSKRFTILFVLTLIAVLFLPVSRSYAADSGAGVWDFLLFGNMDIGQSVKAYSTTGPGTAPVTGNGYGLGFGTEVWFSDRIAARLLVQADIFASPAGGNSNIQKGPFFGMIPVTIGPVFKLIGSTNYFVYLPVDLGYAATVSSGPPGGNSTNVSVVNGGSFYGDVGIGVNIRALTLEAKAAYLAMSNAYSGGFLFFPISIGFDL